MIFVEHLEAYGWESAIRGMRNPKKSHKYSDTQKMKNFCVIGEADEALIKSLIKAGPDHRKLLRQVMISCDITAPLYWWKEFDQYKVGTTTNSESTMHTLHNEPIELMRFAFDGVMDVEDDHFVIDKYLFFLEKLRKEYLRTGDKKHWRALIQLLPCSWKQKRTVTMNFEVALNMLKNRENHKLIEWRIFCKELLDMPYMKRFHKANKGE